MKLDLDKAARTKLCKIDAEAALKEMYGRAFSGRYYMSRTLDLLLIILYLYIIIVYVYTDL